MRARPGAAIGAHSSDATAAPHILRSARSCVNECDAGRPADLEPLRPLFQSRRPRSRRRPEARCGRCRGLRQGLRGQGGGPGRQGAGRGGRQVRGAERPDGPHRLLCLALLCAGHGRSRARSVLAGRLRVADRHRHQAGVLQTGDQQARRRRPGRQAEGSGPGQVRPVAARSSRLTARTSCPTSWRRRCTRSTSSAAPPGRACSTRPSRACAIRSATSC